MGVVPYKRVRQHVNPFAGKLATMKPCPVNDLDWDRRLARPDNPFHIDLGCAAGNYLFTCAERTCNVNYVGLEIRKQLVDVAAYRQARDRFDNLTFIHCNLIVPGALDAVLQSIGARARVQSVSIFHPDPNFKRKRRKRTVLTPLLVESLANRLPKGAHVYLQSDVKPLFLEMVNVMSSNICFSPLPDTAIGQDYCSDHDNAMGVRTDREISVLKQEGQKVWRKNFLKI